MLPTLEEWLYGYRETYPDVPQPSIAFAYIAKGTVVSLTLGGVLYSAFGTHWEQAQARLLEVMGICGLWDLVPPRTVSEEPMVEPDELEDARGEGLLEPPVPEPRTRPIASVQVRRPPLEPPRRQTQRGLGE